MFGGRHPADRYRFRSHRARSVVLTGPEMVEIRAAQRTFEDHVTHILTIQGAYMRTSISLFSFSLIILKIFTAEFYPIGALFAAYASGVMLVSAYRRHQGNTQFFAEVGEDGVERRKFRTSGNVVAGLTLLSVCAFAALLVLTFRLGE
ncbi:hypothetical protein BDY21DRAFT_381436 [Lineolata rhizophorae]|uniref:DUF202 domain-containing protein n=1 Tax=Lineolata rhizophorae TaxID=578093 RepID=A0A6A6NSA8_9PEZI|nr:hypothetical protein BDY21DRAFT_381436 [Lineolata rhizophorae]